MVLKLNFEKPDGRFRNTRKSQAGKRKKKKKFSAVNMRRTESDLKLNCCLRSAAEVPT